MRTFTWVGADRTSRFCRFGAIVLMLAVGAGCAPPPQDVEFPGKVSAYGVRSGDDWFLRAKSRSCVESCQRQKRTDRQAICYSDCPGFVSAYGSSCQEQPDWDACVNVSERQMGQSQDRNTASAVFGVLLVGSLLAGCIYAQAATDFKCVEELLDDDDDDDDEW